MNFKAYIAEGVAATVDVSVDDVLPLIEIPPSADLGDFALPCFSFAKRLKKAPQQVASDLASRLSIPEVKTEAKGPYLNFFVNAEKVVARFVSQVVESDNYGSSDNASKTVVIDYSGPNVAKNMGIHNLRSTIIGQALVNIYRFLGYKVVGVNHLGDWGTQFGKLIWALEKWSSPEELQEKGIIFLNTLYIKFHDEFEKTNDSAMEEEARAWFKRIEEGDERAIMWWKLFIDISMKEYNKIYARLNVSFDDTKGESYYIQFLDNTIKELESKNLVSESQGALVVDFNDEQMPPCLLKKSDGATLYGTRDIAAGLYRLKEYSPFKVLYLTDIAQELHFKQVFRVLEMVDAKNKDVFEHVSFGRLSFPDRAMSTRKGNIISVSDVLDKAKEKVLSIIEEKNPGLQDKDSVAEQVGSGAIIFGDLSQDRVHNIIFSWDTVLDFQGETAPYIQYTVARINSMLRNSSFKDVDYSKISGAEEKQVAFQLGAFPDILQTVVRTNKPHHLAKYAVALSQQFNNYYGKHKILHDDVALRSARLVLALAVKRVLERSLNLLGVSCPEEM